MATMREEAEALFGSLETRREARTEGLKRHLTVWELRAIERAIEELGRHKINELVPGNLHPLVRLQMLVSLAHGGLISERLRQKVQWLIDERGWTQSKIASCLGVDQGHVSRFIHGGRLNGDVIDRLGLLVGAVVDFDYEKAFEAMDKRP